MLNIDEQNIVTELLYRNSFLRFFSLKTVLEIYQNYLQNIVFGSMSDTNKRIAQLYNSIEILIFINEIFDLYYRPDITISNIFSNELFLAMNHSLLEKTSLYETTKNRLSKDFNIVGRLLQNENSLFIIKAYFKALEQFVDIDPQHNFETIISKTGNLKIRDLNIHQLYIFHEIGDTQFSIDKDKILDGVIEFNPKDKWDEFRRKFNDYSLEGNGLETYVFSRNSVEFLNRFMLNNQKTINFEALIGEFGDQSWTKIGQEKLLKNESKMSDSVIRIQKSWRAHLLRSKINNGRSC